MGTARIEIAGVNLLQADPTAHIEIIAVNLIMTETAQWQAVATSVSAASGTLGYTAFIPCIAHPPLLGMKEIYEWNTDVMRSKDGSEQRMSIRSTPHLTIQHDVYLNNEQEQARVESLLFGYAKQSWAVPMWSEYTTHAGNIAAGDTQILFDTSEADYHDGGFAIIWQTPQSFEIVAIGTVASDRLNLSSPAGFSWGGSQLIMPVRLGYLRSSSMFKSTADGQAHYSCTYSIYDNELLTGYVADTTYNSLTVIDKSSHEDKGLELSVDSDPFVQDYGLGDFDFFSDSDYNIYVQGHTFRNKGRTEVWNFKLLLHSLFGRQVPVWVPTDKADFVLKYAVGGAATILTMEAAGWAQYMQLNAFRTHLAFYFTDGTMIFREVTALEKIEDSGGNLTTNVTLAVPLARAVQPGDCVISFLDKCRLSSDRVEVEYDEPFRNYCRTNFTRVLA